MKPPRPGAFVSQAAGFVHGNFDSSSLLSKQPLNNTELPIKTNITHRFSQLFILKNYLFFKLSCQACVIRELRNYRIGKTASEKEVLTRIKIPAEFLFAKSSLFK